jgi:hypothetical protein
MGFMRMQGYLEMVDWGVVFRQESKKYVFFPKISLA